MTSTAAALADQYFAMWNETDLDRRAKIIEEAWSTDGVYVDPSFEVRGYQGLSEMVAAAHRLFPGHAFALTGTIDEHHNHLRWTWNLAAGNTEPIAGGTDVVSLDAEGKIREVIGFLNFAPVH